MKEYSYLSSNKAEKVHGSDSLHFMVKEIEFEINVVLLVKFPGPLNFTPLFSSQSIIPFFLNWKIIIRC